MNELEKRWATSGNVLPLFTLPRVFNTSVVLRLDDQLDPLGLAGKGGALQNAALQRSGAHHPNAVPQLMNTPPSNAQIMSTLQALIAAKTEQNRASMDPQASQAPLRSHQGIYLASHQQTEAQPLMTTQPLHQLSFKSSHPVQNFYSSLCFPHTQKGMSSQFHQNPIANLTCNSMSVPFVGQTPGLQGSIAPGLSIKGPRKTLSQPGNHAPQMSHSHGPPLLLGHHSLRKEGDGYMARTRKHTSGEPCLSSGRKSKVLHHLHDIVFEPRTKRKELHRSNQVAENASGTSGRLSRARQKQGDKWQKEAAAYKRERSGREENQKRESNQLLAFRNFLQCEEEKGVVNTIRADANDTGNPLGVKTLYVLNVDAWWADITSWFEVYCSKVCHVPGLDVVALTDQCQTTNTLISVPNVPHFVSRSLW